jgi:hypothetical protein
MLKRTICGSRVVEIGILFSVVGVVLGSRFSLLEVALWLSIALMGLCAIGGLWLVYEGARVLKTGVFPAPGCKWSANNTVRHGRAARVQGWSGVVLGGVVVILVPAAYVIILG